MRTWLSRLDDRQDNPSKVQQGTQSSKGEQWFATAETGGGFHRIPLALLHDGSAEYGAGPFRRTPRYAAVNHADLDLCHVEPAPVLRCVEPLRDARASSGCVFRLSITSTIRSLSA